MPGEKFTKPAAEYLRTQLDPAQYYLFHDHGAKASQKLYVWFGDDYSVPRAPKHLAHLDLAVVEKQSRRVLALVELEDSTANPKTLIGDVVATLLGCGLSIDNQQDWHLGDWTRLLVLAHVKSMGAQQQHQPRIDHLQEHLRTVHASLSTPNAAIGRVVVDSFVTQGELEEKLMQYLALVKRPA